MALVASAAFSCGTSKTYETLYVSVTSAVDLSADRLSFWIVKDDASGRMITPRDPDYLPAYSFDVFGRDLSAEPFTIQFKPGSSFTGEVAVVVLAMTGNRVVGRAVVVGDLSWEREVEAELKPTTPECDGDGDGFPACGVEGCCGPGEVFGDCDDKEARATPVGFEDECTNCGFGEFLTGDSIDDDCSGQAARCTDADEDQSKDCVPTWCSHESAGSPNCLLASQAMDCDPADPQVYPSALELCDYKDNDCNGTVDDNAPTTIEDWDGAIRSLGDSCGTGVCEQDCSNDPCVDGVVECDPATGKARCSTAYLKADSEICGNGLDDDCNGLTDQEDGCDQDDLDGDGVEDDVEDKYCGPLGKFHSEIFPEHDPVLRPDVPKNLAHPYPEPCCCGYGGQGDCPQACDFDCDGSCHACSVADQDCDGYQEGPDTDCDDSDPSVHAGAPEKCGDGVDQDCKGGDLPCSELDLDKDGYFADFGDCNDSDQAVNPGAVEACNGLDDDCNGYVDDGNPEGDDAVCGTDVGECVAGVMACAWDADALPSEVVICVGDVGPAPENCEGKDEDCNGLTDDVFHYDETGGQTCNDDLVDEPCPDDWPIVAQACVGIGECGNMAGTVECAAVDQVTCSTNPDGSDRQDKAEACDNLDNDCDGATDEDLTDVNMSTCISLGVCGGDGHQYIQAKCQAGEWLCSYAAVPGYEPETDKETLCDDLDNDCDGVTDEGFQYWDGVHPDPFVKGAGCGSGECANGKVVCADDHTGLVCDTSVQQDTEVCDGLDNDCDGQVDEDFGYLGTPIYKDPADITKGRNACKGVGECGNFDGEVECASLSGATCSTNPGASDHKDTEESCDNLDNDCDGVTDENLTDVQESDCLMKGVCLDGADEISAVCQAGKWFCDYTQVPGYEKTFETMCDGLDNDCDGAADEDFILTDWDGSTKLKGYGCGTGNCEGGKVQCAADLSGVLCSTALLAKPETCNYLDDDCDGDTDEGHEYLGKKVSESCVGVGECGTFAGVVECHPVLGQAVCSTNPDGSGSKAVGEFCDGKDNDCNGLTDEGLDIDSPDCTCLKTGVCDPGKVVAACSGAKWVCDYGAIPDFETPAETKCDLKDNDCDGDTDEGTDGSCDDGLPCTADACTGGTCTNDLIAGNCLIQGNCHVQGSANLANQCQVCDPVTDAMAWTNRGDGDACDFDGDGCTQGDSCQGGTCEVGTPLDCSGLDDQCRQGKCKSTGAQSAECEAVAIKETEPCDDGDACTSDDACASGVCAGISYGCDDQIACTNDGCDGLGGCDNSIKEGWCLIPGNGCVAAGTDRPGTFCQACLPAKSSTAWSNKDDTTPCDDSDACTENEKCQSGQCTGGTTRDCDDHNQCTADGCDVSTGCTYQVTPGKNCDDMNDCTYDDTCSGIGGDTCLGAAYACDDSLNCTGDVCDGFGGCLYPIGKDWCVIGDSCVARDTAKPGNTCMECNPDLDQEAWSPVSNGTACTDQNACTDGDECSDGTCAPGPALDCDDSNTCTDDGCNPVIGCTHQNNSALCVDSKCQDGSYYPPVYCSSGSCGNQVPVDCDDGKSCNTDECQPMVGCFYIDTCPNLNPTCTVDGCRCGTSTCDSQTADNCLDNTQCRCGAEAACASGDQCCSGVCQPDGSC